MPEIKTNEASPQNWPCRNVNCDQEKFFRSLRKKIYAKDDKMISSLKELDLNEFINHDFVY